MLTHLHNVSVPVTDQAAALEFYTARLGFEVRDNVEFMPGARWLTVAPPGAQTCFALWPAAMMPELLRQPGGFRGLGFSCDDAQGTHDAFAAAGVQITTPLKQEPWGKTFMFADQDGNIYNVVEHA